MKLLQRLSTLLLLIGANAIIMGATRSDTRALELDQAAFEKTEAAVHTSSVISTSLQRAFNRVGGQHGPFMIALRKERDAWLTTNDKETLTSEDQKLLYTHLASALKKQGLQTLIADLELPLDHNSVVLILEHCVSKAASLKHAITNLPAVIREHALMPYVCGTPTALPDWLSTWLTKRTEQLHFSPEYVVGCDISADQTMCAVGFNNGITNVYEYRDGAAHFLCDLQHDRLGIVDTIALNANGSVIALVSKAGTSVFIYRRQAKTNTWLFEQCINFEKYTNSQNGISCPLIFSATGTTLIIVGFKKVGFYEFSSGQWRLSKTVDSTLLNLGLSNNLYCSAKLSGDASTCAIQRLDGEIEVYTRTASSWEEAFTTEKADRECFNFNEDSDVLITAADSLTTIYRRTPHQVKLSENVVATYKKLYKWKKAHAIPLKQDLLTPTSDRIIVNRIAAIGCSASTNTIVTFNASLNNTGFDTGLPANIKTSIKICEQYAPGKWRTTPFEMPLGIKNLGVLAYQEYYINKLNGYLIGLGRCIIKKVTDNLIYAQHGNTLITIRRGPDGWHTTSWVKDRGLALSSIYRDGALCLAHYNEDVPEGTPGRSVFSINRIAEPIPTTALTSLPQTTFNLLHSLHRNRSSGKAVIVPDAQMAKLKALDPAIKHMIAVGCSVIPESRQAAIRAARNSYSSSSSSSSSSSEMALAAPSSFYAPSKLVVR